MKKQKSEKGQIVVILALGMVAIAAITALAIDGSLVFNERRQDQNTADSAALAGAGAAANYLKDISSGVLICGTPVGTAVTQLIVNAVHASVLVDGISAAEMPKLESESSLAAADQGFTVTCNWFGPLGTQYLDIHVKKSTNMATNFARVLSQNTLKTTIESTARVYPRQPFAYGNGLVSLSSSCSTKQGGIQFGGTSSTYINAGGVFSNSCIKAASSSTIVHVIDGSIQYWNSDVCIHCDDADMIPDATKAYVRLRKDLIAAPTCPAKNAGNTHNSKYYTGSINPGWYTSGISTKNAGDSLTLNPGLYCIEGDVENNSQSIFIANDVTLYFLSGNLTINQNDAGKVQLSSCAKEPCGNPSAVQGLLMYFSPLYTATVKINGGSTNAFTGTIYGAEANFTLNGNSDTTTGEPGYDFNTQIVGNWIEVTGKANLVMNLNSDDFAPMPPSLSLVK